MNNTPKKIVKAANKHVAFRIHLTIYLLVNLFLWITWYFIFKADKDSTMFNTVLYLTLAWLIALVSHYLIAYRWNKKMVDKEIEKMLEREKISDIDNVKHGTGEGK